MWVRKKLDRRMAFFVRGYKKLSEVLIRPFQILIDF